MKKIFFVCSIIAVLNFGCSTSKVNNQTPKIVEQPVIEEKTPSLQESSNLPTPSEINYENIFAEALATAEGAVTISNGATTQEDWKLVASQWQNAINTLKKIPEWSPYHERAKQKIAEYQKNLTQAQNFTTQKSLLNNQDNTQEINSFSTVSSSVSGKVAIVFKNGDVKPFARRVFMLLPFSANDLWVSASLGSQPKAPEMPIITPDNFETWDKDMEKWQKENDEWQEKHDKWEKDFFARVDQARAKFLATVKTKASLPQYQDKIFQFQTDFEGNYLIKNIPPGVYYITNNPIQTSSGDWVYGDTKIGLCNIEWNYKLIIESNQSLKIDLSNDNADELVCR